MRILYDPWLGQRLTDYAVKTQQPVVGWLLIEDTRDGHTTVLRARLVDEGGRDLLWMDHAHVRASRGRQGMLIEGVNFQAKGRKHSHGYRQAWWCHAPPRAEPLVDHAERVRRATEEYLRRQAADG